LDQTDLLIGLVASAGVTWLSVWLMPLSHRRIKPGALAVQTCQFLWISVVAGVDVAMRAFYPRVRVNPGFVVCPCRVPEGASRDMFLAISSLVPGSLPAGIEDGRVIIHCLDIAQPVAAQMAENETQFMKVLGEEICDE
jgi:multicomponent Na+:H+ antiporter subunit E